MKAIILTLVSALIIGFSSTSNASIINPKTGDLEKLIQKQISYPQFAKEQKLDGVVLVSFTVNSDGSINVNTTNQSDIRFKEYVVSKLKSLKIKSGSKSAKTYNVKFDFKYVK